MGLDGAMTGTYGALNATTANLSLRDSGSAEGDGLSDAEALNSGAAECREARPRELVSAVARPLDEFQEIFNRYARPVMGFLRDLLGDRTLAEEMTQETFVRAYRARGSKRAETRISTWLFGIALNVAREAIRDKYRRQSARGLDDPACRDLQDERRSPAQNLIDQETKRIIQAALLHLSEAQRIVFILKVVNQMRYQEIIAITGASIGKLKTDLHRARLEMRRMLEPYVNRQTPEMRGNS